MNPSAANTSTNPTNHSLSARRRRGFIIVILTFFLIAQELVLRILFPLPAVWGFNRIRYTPVKYFNKNLFQLSPAPAAEETPRGLAHVRIRWESAPDGFAFEHSLNIYGFRGSDFSIAPPADRPRVLFIGDSFVEGCGAADDDTLPRQFERLMASRKPVEAINLGVAGTGFIEYSELLRDTVPLLHPTTVFVVTCANDLPTPPAAAEAGRLPPVIRAKNPCVPQLVRIIERLIDGEIIPRRFYGGPFPFFEAVPSPSNPLSARPPPANIDPQILAAMKAGKCNPWNLGICSKYARSMSEDFGMSGGVRDRLRRFADFCRQHDCRLIVVYVPYNAQVNPIYLAAQNRLGGPAVATLTDPQFFHQQEHLRQVCQSIGITYIDTTDAFTQAELTTNQRYFWPIDAHCNARGYGLIAGLCEQAFR